LYQPNEFQDLEKELGFFRWSLGRVDVYEVSLPDDLKTELHNLYESLQELGEKLEERVSAHSSKASAKKKTA